MKSDIINNNLADLQIIWEELSRSDTLPSSVDVIVVGGSTDIGTAETAASLYQGKHSRKIIVSGYAQPGMRLTEASLLASKCISLGVSTGDVLLEKKASNTGQNILLSAQLAGKVESVTLIHKPYMTRRFLATAESQWPTPQPIFFVTHEDVSMTEYFKKFDPMATIWAMLGDFRRMSEYAKKGFQTEQVMSPDSVLAYRRLITQGFDVR